jgi:hypothetical protein
MMSSKPSHQTTTKQTKKEFEASLDKVREPLCQKTELKKGWGCGSSSRVPAFQVQRPEFKSFQSKKEKDVDRKKK